MKKYRRILVSLPADGHGERVLRRAAELVPAGRSELMVLRVLDTRSGFEADGPAAGLPEDIAGRRLPGEKKRLDLMLARNDLAWAESRVIHGEPRSAMVEFIRSWRPDLVVTCADLASGELAEDPALDQPDVLAVRRRRLFGWLGAAGERPAAGYA